MKLKKQIPAFAGMMVLFGLAEFAAPAMAGTMPLYLSLGAGLTHAHDADWNDEALGESGSISLNDSGNISAAVGANITQNIRTEFEISYRENDLDTLDINNAGSAKIGGELKSWGFLVNGYYDFLPTHKLDPYVSVGLGALSDKGTISGGGISLSDSDTVFAYQAGAGVSYQIMPKTALWAGYRYLGSDKPDFDGLKAKYNADEFRAGVRFNF